MILSQNRFTASRGIARNGDDRLRGTIIESLLCQGRTRVDPDFQRQLLARLLPFSDCGLLSFEGEWLVIAPAGLPYVRSIAAQFDTYRETSPQRFSSAV
jgi:oxygen-independent coproporphyrinogen-3 oxidase